MTCIIGSYITVCLNIQLFRTFFEYIERKELLQTPEEQSRLLENFPVVTPEVLIDVEPKNQDTVDDEKDEASPQLVGSEGNETSRR